MVKRETPILRGIILRPTGEKHVYDVIGQKDSVVKGTPTLAPARTTLEAQLRKRFILSTLFELFCIVVAVGVFSAIWFFG
jgi:hypothetical protein